MAMFRIFLKYSLWTTEGGSRLWTRTFDKKVWKWAAGETGVPLARLPDLWNTKFCEHYEGHAFPFEELGGTNEEDLGRIVTSNCGDIASVSDGTPPLLFPPAEGAMYVPSAKTSRIEVFVHMNVDRKQKTRKNLLSAGAGGVPKKTGAKRDSSGGGGGGGLQEVQMVSDHKAANMLKKSKVDPDSHDRDATKILIKIGKDVSGANLAGQP